MLTQPEFWILIGFIIFVMLTYKSVKNLLSKSINSKIQKIINEIDTIKLHKTEIEKELAAYQNKKRNILSEIEELKLNSKKEIIAIKERYENEIERYVESKTRAAKNKIASYEASIIKDLQNNAIEQITLLIENITKDKIDQNTDQKILNDALKDIDAKSRSLDSLNHS